MLEVIIATDGNDVRAVPVCRGGDLGLCSAPPAAWRSGRRPAATCGRDSLSRRSSAPPGPETAARRGAEPCRPGLRAGRGALVITVLAFGFSAGSVADDPEIGRP